MNTCDTCKWWDFSKDDSFPDIPIQRPCVNAKVTGSNARKTDENVLMHGGWAELYTGPKFGCIHHEYSKDGCRLDIERAKEMLKRCDESRDPFFHSMFYMQALVKKSFLEEKLKEMDQK